VKAVGEFDQSGFIGYREQRALDGHGDEDEFVADETSSAAAA
jgi:hypothetical protein